MTYTSFKNPRILNDYRVIHLPNHPAAMKSKNWDGYVYEHIVVATKYLGRQLNDKEVVHHLDGNRLNNKHANLLVVEQSQHGKLHAWMASGAPGIEKLRENWVNSMDPKFITKVRTEEFTYCKVCNLMLQDNQHGYCGDEHYQLQARKVERPSLEQLLQDVNYLPMTKIGLKYGVSDNAVRKWFKAYGVDKATLSQAKATALEGAETSGEVKPS